MLQATIEAQAHADGPRIIKTYDYTNQDGEVVYQVCRLDPKDFRQRRPDGNGGWIWNLNGVRRVLYRLPEPLKLPHAGAFICEGEKDSDNVAALGYCATTVASGDWKNIDVSALADRDMFILADADKAGDKKALAAANKLKATSIRIVLMPDGAKDVSDWLDGDPTRADRLLEVCVDTPLWKHVTDTVPNEHRGVGEGEECRERDEPREDVGAKAPVGVIGVSLDDFLAHMPTHTYIFRPTRDMWPASSVNVRMGYIPVVDNTGQPILDANGEQKRVPAARWLDKHRPEDGLWRVYDRRQVIYAKSALPVRDRCLAAQRLQANNIKNEGDAAARSVVSMMSVVFYLFP
jgi:hypothetical protein